MNSNPDRLTVYESIKRQRLVLTYTGQKLSRAVKERERLNEKIRKARQERIQQWFELMVDVADKLEVDLTPYIEQSRKFGSMRASWQGNTLRVERRRSDGSIQEYPFTAAGYYAPEGSEANELLQDYLNRFMVRRFCNDRYLMLMEE